MAEFAANLQCYKPTLQYLDMESSIELMNQFPEINPNVLLENNSNLALQRLMNGTYCDEYSFAHQEQPEFPVFNTSLDNNHQHVYQSESSNAVPIAHQSEVSNKKRKSIADTNESSGKSSAHAGLGGVNEANKAENNPGTKRKKGKNNEEDSEMLAKEVIHVRARRGQATDSHSLAERVRREKINERLRCLRHLVPGCYKTMGMSVMLDEIIKYVQSLQNQIEFLSMKLAAASTLFDFSLDMESSQAFQGTNVYDAQEMEGYGGLPRTQVPTFPL